MPFERVLHSEGRFEYAEEWGNGHKYIYRDSITVSCWDIKVSDSQRLLSRNFPNLGSFDSNFLKCSPPLDNMIIAIAKIAEDRLRLNKLFKMDVSVYITPYWTCVGRNCNYQALTIDIRRTCSHCGLILENCEYCAIM